MSAAALHLEGQQRDRCHCISKRALLRAKEPYYEPYYQPCTWRGSSVTGAIALAKEPY